MGSNLSFFKSLIKQKAKVSYYRDLSLKKSRLEFNTFTLIFDPNIKSYEILTSINQIANNSSIFNSSDLNKLIKDIDFFLASSSMNMDTILRNDKHFLKLSFVSVDGNIILNIIDLSFVNNFKIPYTDQIFRQTASTIWITDASGTIKGVSEQWDITAKYYEDLEMMKGSNRKAVYSKDLIGKNFSTFLVGRKSKIFYSFVRFLINLFGKLSHEYWAQSPCETECKQEELLHMLYLKQKLKIGNKIYHFHQSINFTQLTDALLLELYLNRKYQNYTQCLKFPRLTDYNLFLLLNSFQSNELFVQNLHNYLLLINRNYRIRLPYMSYQIYNNYELNQISSTSSNSITKSDYDPFSITELFPISQGSLKVMEGEYSFDNQQNMHMLLTGHLEIASSVNMNVIDSNQSTNNLNTYSKNIQNCNKHAKHDFGNGTLLVIRKSDNQFMIKHSEILNKTHYAHADRSSSVTESRHLNKLKVNKNDITNWISTPNFKQQVFNSTTFTLLNSQIHTFNFNHYSIRMFINQRAQPLQLLVNNLESGQVNFMARDVKLFDHYKSIIENDYSKTYLRSAQAIYNKRYFSLPSSLIDDNHPNMSNFYYEVLDSWQSVENLPVVMNLISYNNNLQKVELVTSTSTHTIYDNVRYRIMHKPKVIDLDTLVQHLTNKTIFASIIRDYNTKVRPIAIVSDAIKPDTVITNQDDNFVVSLHQKKIYPKLSHVKRLQNIQYLFSNVLKIIYLKIRKGDEKRKNFGLQISTFIRGLFKAFWPF